MIESKIELHSIKYNLICEIQDNYYDTSYLDELTKEENIKEIFLDSYKIIRQNLIDMDIKYFEELISTLFSVCRCDCKKKFLIEASDNWKESGDEKKAFISFINYSCILSFCHNFNFIFNKHSNIRIFDNTSILFIYGDKKNIYNIKLKILDYFHIELRNNSYNRNYYIIIDECGNYINDDEILEENNITENYKENNNIPKNDDDISDNIKIKIPLIDSKKIKNFDINLNNKDLIVDYIRNIFNE